MRTLSLSWSGARQGLITSGLNHVMHVGANSLRKKLIIGIYGTGDVNLSQNQELRNIVESRGGIMYGDELTFGAETINIQDIAKNTKRGTQIEIYGYSRGGNEAVDLTIAFGNRGIVVHKLVLIDAHSLTGDLSLFHANVKKVYNFFQNNPRTGGSLGWWGKNPYTGSPLSLKGNRFSFVENGMIKFGKVKPTVNQTLINNSTVNHLNIVRFVYRNYKF